MSVIERDGLFWTTHDERPFATYAEAVAHLEQAAIICPDCAATIPIGINRNTGRPSYECRVCEFSAWANNID